jgi:uncharacterized membrane-anchored protein YhcB (DUF1043 family)
MELVSLTLLITSTVFVTLGAVAFRQQQICMALTNKVQESLKESLESLAKLHNETASEFATLKKDISDLQVINGLKGKNK